MYSDSGPVADFIPDIYYRSLFICEHSTTCDSRINLNYLNYVYIYRINSSKSVLDLENTDIDTKTNYLLQLLMKVVLST